MPISNYPNGFSHGVSIRGVPLLNTHAGNVFWVDSGTGSNSNNGTYGQPFSTLAYALTRCTASNGDVIILFPGHAETVSTATALDLNVAGVSVIGAPSVGTLRPTFTVDTAATATVTISAANVTVENVLFIANLDGLNSTLTVTGANCYLDIEHRDTSSLIEADIAITVTGDQFTCRLRDIGFAGGDQRDQSITLNGVDNARIDIDFYGKVATSVVDMITAACTDVEVRGTMYVSGTTDGSKNVTATITGSTWYMDVVDAAAGARFTGGSAAAVASDDISTITAALYGAAGIATWPASAAPANGVSIAEALRYLDDAVQGANGVVTFPAAAAPANGVSLAEVLRDIWDALRNGTGGTEPGTNKSVIDAIGFDGAAAVAASAGMLRTANGTRFVVKKTLTSSAVVQAGVDVTAVSTVGDIVIEDFTIQADGTGLAAGTNFTLETNNTKGSAVFCSHAVASLGANTLVDMKGASTGKHVVLESGKKIVAKCTVADCTGAGTIDVYLLCRRLADNATLAAA